MTTQNNPFGGTFDKIDAITDAYSQLRISGLTAIPTPSDLELALSRLESMAAEWAERNICSQYNFEETPDPNSDSGVRLAYKQAFSTNLALRLTPDFGKVPDPVLASQASQSLSNLSGRAAMDRVRGVQYPNRQPMGSGNTLRYNRWNRFYQTGASAPNSCKTVQMHIGDINDFVEHFDAYLKQDDVELISSVDFSADSGLTILSSSFTDTDVNYQIRADGSSGSTSNEVQQLVIIVTTDAGRVTTRVVQFELSARPETQ